MEILVEAGDYDRFRRNSPDPGGSQSRPMLFGVLGGGGSPFIRLWRVFREWGPKHDDSNKLEAKASISSRAETEERLELNA